MTRILQDPEVRQEHNLQDFCLLQMNVMLAMSTGVRKFHSYQLGSSFLAFYSTCFFQILFQLSLFIQPLQKEDMVLLATCCCLVLLLLATWYCCCLLLVVAWYCCCLLLVVAWYCCCLLLLGIVVACYLLLGIVFPC